MIDSLNNMKQYGSVAIILISIFAILISGLFFGITYYVMDSVDTAFQSTNCTIENNVYVDNCQELWALSIYPFLALKNLLIWASFFFIFALALGIIILGYQSGNNPVLLGFLVVIVSVVTYISIEVSNIYRTLIENDLFRSMMTEFTVYNKIMLSFPWFIFIISAFALIMGIVNWQKTKVNSPKDELNY